MKRILTLGAYDRDNFGDILFYLVLKKYLDNDSRLLVPGGLTTSDMTSLMNEEVLPVSALLEAEKWDTVWVVGGEVGGVPVDVAISIVTDKDFKKTYQQLNEATKAKYNSLMAYDTSKLANGYIPDVESIANIQETKFVIGSVGLASLSVVSEEIREKVNSSLKYYQRIWVRDIASKEYCDKNGINAALAPDAVHALSLRYGSMIKKPEALPEKYIVFQLNEADILNSGARNLAQQLDSLHKKTGFHILFFAAGTANNHDSFGQYSAIQSLMNYRSETSIFTERDPLVLAGCIAHSQLWVGSSLHGRVLAATYAIPRISLENQKVATYARYWDNESPFNVSVSDIVIASIDALKVKKANLVNIADKLELLADKQMQQIVEEVA